MSLHEVPRNFREFVSTDGKRASLGNMNLTRFPEWLEMLTTLTTLDLSGNQLSDLPASFGNHTKLTELNLSDNKISQLPQSFGNLTALKTLNLSDNRLFQLPESIGNLTDLTTLELAGNPLYYTIPESIGNLTALTTLSMDGSQLMILPESVGNLTALTTLSVGGTGGCSLSSLPQSISNLTALTALRIRGTQQAGLTAIPESIGNLAALRTLDFSGNHLSALPERLGDLAALTTLDLSGNQLTALPESLRNLTALTTLNLSGNQLATLQALLIPLLDKGGQLKVDDNPLGDPLPSLINRGTDALVSYLRSIEFEQATELHEAKLLLVGEGNVGKTSLVAALADSPFVEGRPTTHGIEISTLIFRYPGRDEDMVLRAWDFGGQEVYRVTHQFFFSPRALYLLVWNPREGQEQDQVEGWLRRIRLRVGEDARVIVVATHCTDRQPELDYPSLKLIFKDMLVDQFNVDSRTLAGIPELRSAIAKHASTLPQMGQRISHRWVEAQAAVIGLAKDEPQINFEHFAEICKHRGVVKQEVLTLAQLMHDLGHIIYYSEDEGLKDIVVLNAEWLTKAISYVLEEKRIRDAGGFLDHAWLRDIWQDRDQGPTYPARYHPYFLRLMEKFDVSYRLETDELRTLVAQLVTHDRPTNLPWDFRTLPDKRIRTLSMICRLSEPAPGLIPWLTVRHHRASTGKHWRRGVFLTHPIAAYASDALLELRRADELAVEVRAPSPDLYFHVLRDSIEELLTRRWPGITYELTVPCPGISADGSKCLGWFPLKGLLMLREKGHTVLPCIDCGTGHEINFLLTGFTVPVQPPTAELAQINEQLAHMNAHIEIGFVEMEGQAARTADLIRRVLRVVSAEITDCPRLMTLTQERRTGAKRARFYEDGYRLTLWCEHPGYWHPWIPASYELRRPKEWFARVGPYLSLVLRTLQLVFPITGPAADILLPSDQLAFAQKDLNLMSAIVAELPNMSNLAKTDPDLTSSTNRFVPAEDEALRVLRSTLLEHDRFRSFGGLRRVQDPSGDFLWVCQNHYSKYDPGLPAIP
jgi:Leucine-rich repeat (LRR) protein